MTANLSRIEPLLVELDVFKGTGEQSVVVECQAVELVATLVFGKEAGSRQLEKVLPVDKENRLADIRS